MGNVLIFAAAIQSYEKCFWYNNGGISRCLNISRSCRECPWESFSRIIITMFQHLFFGCVFALFNLHRRPNFRRAPIAISHFFVFQSTWEQLELCRMEKGNEGNSCMHIKKLPSLIIRCDAFHFRDNSCLASYAPTPPTPPSVIDVPTIHPVEGSTDRKFDGWG